MAKDKTKPNDPCHCGSGKKYKKCCSIQDQQQQQLEKTAEQFLSQYLSHQQQQQDPLNRSDSRSGRANHTTTTDSMKNMYTIDIEHEKQYYFQLGYGKAYIAAIEDCFKKFLKEKGNNDDDDDDEEPTQHQYYYTALDFCSGAGVFPVEYDNYFRKNNNHSYPLIWYCSEYTNPDGNRNPLRHLATCQAILMNEHSPRFGPEKYGKLVKKFPDLVCSDMDGSAIFCDDQVKLSGLKNESFNGLLGSVQGIDLSSSSKKSNNAIQQQRVAVALDGREKAISFKPENLILMKNGIKLNVSYDKAIEMRTDFDAVQALSQNRTINIDLQDEDHCWVVGRKTRLEMQCAIVTCTSLLTEVGYRIPLVWQDALNRASYFLQYGGYFLHHDTPDFGDFGNEEKMRLYGKEKCLFEMELVSITEPVKHPKNMQFLTISGKMILVIWKKVGH